MINTDGVYLIEKDTELTSDLIQSFIVQHNLDSKHGRPHYELLDRYYKGEHVIFDDSNVRKQQTVFKPDNRIMVNMSKYLVDTFNGYFIGNPPTIGHDDETVNKDILMFMRRNYMDDVLNETAKLTAIFGRAFMLLYADENGEINTMYQKPTDMFMIYDNTIKQSPVAAVYYSWNETGKDYSGTVYTRDEIISISGDAETTVIGEREPHYFNHIPVVEFLENEERRGVFEDVITLIDAVNNALSNKANDVEYFADAYMYIIGAVLKDDQIDNVVKNRIINITGKSPSDIKLGFLEKPNADTTQENLLNRLMDLIFQVSMVANITDKDFGNTSSGVSLEFKLQPMKNLASNKERKFDRAIREMFYAISQRPQNGVVDVANVFDIEIAFNRNLPRNVENEINNAKNAAGIVSEQTQLELLSFVENPLEEMEKKRNEEQQRLSQYDTAVMFDEEDMDNGFTGNVSNDSQNPSTSNE